MASFKKTGAPEDIWSEVHSLIFIELRRIANDIALGERLTRQGILSRLGSCIDLNDLARMEELIDAVFIFDEEGAASLFIDAPLPALPTLLELAWLKDLLTDRRARFFLSGELREKLLERLEDIEGSGWEENTRLISCRTPRDEETESRIESRLALIREALTEKKLLTYENHSSSGRVYRDTLPPCRLEYDARQSRYSLIAWLDEESRAIKLNPASLASLSLSEKNIPEDTEKKFVAWLKKKREHVSLTLSPKANAVLRAFKLFAPYDKESCYDEEKDLYSLTVYYYSFDERDVLDSIISLGAAAIVTEPEAIREKVIEHFKAAWEIYE